MNVDIKYIDDKSRDAFSRFIDYDCMSRESLSVRCVESGIVVPGPAGGIAENGSMIVESMAYRVACPPKFRKVPDAKLQYDEEVLYLGCFESCWGHCITDDLKHLWPLCGPGAEKYRSMKWVCTLTRPEKQLPQNFIELLALLGIDERKIEKVCEPAKFRKIYLPDECFYADETSCRRYFTKEYSAIVDELIEKAVSGGAHESPAEKIYFTRTGWRKGNPDFGERHLERAFEQKGYRIVRPETLSFAETVRIVNGCRSLAATEGSCAHNSLFMRKGMSLVVVRKADYICEYQIPINQLRDLDVTYIDANGTTLLESKSCPFSGPFFLYCNKRLADYLNVKPCFPVLDWVSYLATWARLKVLRFATRLFRCVSRRMKWLFRKN